MNLVMCVCLWQLTVSVCDSAEANLRVMLCMYVMMNHHGAMMNYQAQPARLIYLHTPLADFKTHANTHNMGSLSWWRGSDEFLMLFKCHHVCYQEAIWNLSPELCFVNKTH